MPWSVEEREIITGESGIGDVGFSWGRDGREGWRMGVSDEELLMLGEWVVAGIGKAGIGPIGAVG